MVCLLYHTIFKKKVTVGQRESEYELDKESVHNGFGCDVMPFFLFSFLTVAFIIIIFFFLNFLFFKKKDSLWGKGSDFRSENLVSQFKNPLHHSTLGPI